MINDAEKCARSFLYHDPCWASKKSSISTFLPSISGEKRSPSLAKNRTHEGWLMIVGPGQGHAQHGRAQVQTTEPLRINHSRNSKPQIDRSLMTFGNISDSLRRLFFFRFFCSYSGFLSMCSHLGNYFHIISFVFLLIDFVQLVWFIRILQDCPHTPGFIYTGSITIVLSEAQAHQIWPQVYKTP